MKNLMAYTIGAYDGHGGRAAMHHAEMEEIAHQVFAEENQKLLEQVRVMVQEESKLAYQQAINDFLGVMHYDVESITKVGFDGCRNIFESKEAQKYISDQIVKEIEKRLNKRK